MHQGISSNLIFGLFFIRFGLPNRNDFHPFNKLMHHMRILLHVYQKKLFFFDIVYFSMKMAIRQVLAHYLEEIPVFCKSWYLIKHKNVGNFLTLRKIRRFHIKISEIYHMNFLKMIDDKGSK